jgi:hypothetical protein
VVTCKLIPNIDLFSSDQSYCYRTRATHIVRRVVGHSDSAVFGILIGGVVGILVVFIAVLLLYTNVRRRQIEDIEKRVVSLDSEISIPKPRSSKRTTWAFRLRTARRNLWTSDPSKEKLHAHLHTFEDVGNPSATSDVDSKSMFLPSYDIPPLQKPPGAVSPDLSHYREKTTDCPTLLSVERAVLPIVQITSDDYPRSGRRKVQFSTEPPVVITPLPPVAPVSVNLPGNAVAQTIIANRQRSRSNSNPTEKRKGSLLSAPPLTGPLESVDTQYISSYYGNAAWFQDSAKEDGAHHDTRF